VRKKYLREYKAIDLTFYVTLLTKKGNEGVCAQKTQKHGASR
jgi:hypothetical protein